MSLFNTVGTEISGMTLDEAMAKAKLNWTVSKRPVFSLSNIGDNYIGTSKHFAIARDDNDHILGIVGTDYQPIQNSELAYMCERIQGTDVVVETAGSLNGGERVWIQMRGNPFGVGPKSDENIPYCVLTNGHNGMHPLDALPTTYRVICQNTLNMALGQARKNKMMISIKHSGNVQSRIESLYNAIAEFRDRTQKFHSKADTLAHRSVNVEFVQKFWTEIYANMFGDVWENPTCQDDERDNLKASSVLTKWSNTFDLESKESGANLWTAVNAVTHWLDHNQLYRGKNKTENRFVDTLYGNGAKEKIKVFDLALSYA